ncbi:uncharacterized protein EI97DRAFT_487852 [Westerdykella ornata]|uniref:Jacalin-type lectin domain-containing protein n=1 Tax=Westerdykella ornata TaxID=318751 RepID=A0A6A6JNK4_WESOR|nr:uncharacterized protein EI97DRAFT_487852 [Westerdykella ornata]KAF2277834.1 hypothetical protein EI97DRAFT_487852 [Westerdykella ornata]
MHFSLFTRGLLLSLAALVLAEDNCDARPDEAPFAPGRVGGVAFPDPADDKVTCVSRWKSGEVIVGMEAWSTRTQITGIKFKFDRTGWTGVMGTTVQGRSWYAKRGEWAADQPVRVEVWNKKSKVFNGPGRIRIFKEGTDEILFEVGIGDSEIEGDKLNDIDQGIGIILGAKTRSAEHLHTIEFKFLKSKVVKTQLTAINVVENLDDWNNEQRGIETVSLAETYYKNHNPIGGPNQTYTFTNTIKKSESKIITQQYTNSWTAGIEVTVGGKVGIPFVAEGEISANTKFEYQRQNMGSTAMSYTYDKDLTNTQGSGVTANMLPPQRAAHCQFDAVSGTFDSAYSGTIEATLADGTKYSYFTDGDIHSVGWAKTSSSCEEMDIKDVPEDVAEGQTADTRKRAVEFHV